MRGRGRGDSTLPLEVCIIQMQSSSQRSSNSVILFQLLAGVVRTVSFVQSPPCGRILSDNLDFRPVDRARRGLGKGKMHIY